MENEQPTKRVVQFNAAMQSYAESSGHKSAFWVHSHSTNVSFQEPTKENRYSPLRQTTTWSVLYFKDINSQAIRGEGSTLHQAYENLVLNMLPAPSMDEQLVGV